MGSQIGRSKVAGGLDSQDKVLTRIVALSSSPYLSLPAPHLSIYVVRSALMMMSIGRAVSLMDSSSKKVTGSAVTILWRLPNLSAHQSGPTYGTRRRPLSRATIFLCTALYLSPSDFLVRFQRVRLPRKSSWSRSPTQPRAGLHQFLPARSTWLLSENSCLISGLIHELGFFCISSAPSVESLDQPVIASA